MKTVKQHLEEVAEGNCQLEARLAEIIKRCSEYQGDLVDPGVAKRLRGCLPQVGTTRLSGLACDHCGTEILHRGVVYATYPPQTPYDCACCGKTYCL